CCVVLLFFFSSRRRHTRFSRDWSSDVCSSDLHPGDRRLGAGGGQVRLGVQLARGLDALGPGLLADLTGEKQGIGGQADGGGEDRSEERRVGKERRGRWTRCH